MLENRAQKASLFILKNTRESCVTSRSNMLKYDLEKNIHINKHLCYNIIYVTCKNISSFSFFIFFHYFFKMAEFFSYGEFESSDEVEDYLSSDNGDYSTILQPF